MYLIKIYTNYSGLDENLLHCYAVGRTEFKTLFTSFVIIAIRFIIRLIFMPSPSKFEQQSHQFKQIERMFCEVLIRNICDKKNYPR